MNKFISSDLANPEMLAAQTFDKILDVIQRSNLNFQLQVSPFSAYISLKKSLVKDRSGSFLQPPPITPLLSPTLVDDVAKHLARIDELESDLQIQKNSCENAVEKCKAANEMIKLCEEKCTKLEKENKALKQENKTLVTKLESKAFDLNQTKATVVELNKDKNALSVALKSAKQELITQSKTSERKLTEHQKKLDELNEYKTKKVNEERTERLQKKKDLKKERKTLRDNNNKSIKDSFAVKEEDLGKNYAEKNYVASVDGRKENSLVNVEPVIDPAISQLADEPSEDKCKEIELEYKEEGFIGPRLPRMLTDEEVKAVFDRLLGHKYK